MIRPPGSPTDRPLAAKTAQPGTTRAARRRPWWKWLAIVVLLAATVTVTILYTTTMARDVSRQHWSAAVDASREAVLALVGWSAVIIVLVAGGDAPDGEAESGEDPARSRIPARQGERDDALPDGDAVTQAQLRVQRLRARLAELAAARERAGSRADPDLDRELASTTARLEKARQWLTSAQSAMTAPRHHGSRPAAG